MDTNTCKSKKTRKSLTLKQKMDIIVMIKTGKSKDEVARELDLSKDTIATIWKRREITEASYIKCSNPETKRSHPVKFGELDIALYHWFVIQKTSNIPIDGPALKSKATSIADTIGITNFSASNGWLDKWKSRHNVKFSQIVDEAASAPEESVTEWSENIWPAIKSGFKDDDIFNADDTGLFYQTETRHSRNDSSRGLKQQKDKVTVFMCANMSGTEKVKLLVIGKNAKPRGFPEKQECLPVTYRANKTAWMSGVLFGEWLRSWDCKLLKKKRKILLLLDNRYSRIEVPHLKSITLAFFPTNATPLLKPMDLGIIRDFKSFYRKFLTQWNLEHLDEKNEIVNISLITAIGILRLSWDCVSSSTIASCFQHAKLQSEAADIIETESFSRNHDAELLSQLLFKKLDGSPEEEDAKEQYIAKDQNTQVSAEPTNTDIIQFLAPIEMEIESTDEEEVTEFASDQPRVINVQKNLAELKLWVQQNNMDDSLYSHISALESAYLNLKIKTQVQRRITDYFSP